MALSPYNITALEEDFATAQGTGKNIVAGALVTLATIGGTPVLMSDNASGSNPSLTKFTDSIGQLVIWVDVDVYDLTVDGGAAIRISVPRADTGTASTADLTTSSTDTTAGRITKVGDFGVGAGVSPVITNWDTVLAGGTYNSVVATQSGSPDDAAPGWVGIVGALNSDNVFQQVWRAGTSFVDVHTRFLIAGTNWTDWKEILTSDNLSFLQNTSGGTITSAVTVAGSGLTPAQTGTWRNVSGASIFDTGYGLWSLV